MASWLDRLARRHADALTPVDATVHALSRAVRVGGDKPRLRDATDLDHGMCLCGAGTRGCSARSLAAAYSCSDRRFGRNPGA